MPVAPCRGLSPCQTSDGLLVVTVAFQKAPFRFCFSETLTDFLSLHSWQLLLWHLASGFERLKDGSALLFQPFSVQNCLWTDPKGEKIKADDQVVFLPLPKYHRHPEAWEKHGPGLRHSDFPFRCLEASKPTPISSRGTRSHFQTSYCRFGKWQIRFLVMPDF